MAQYGAVSVRVVMLQLTCLFFTAQLLFRENRPEDKKNNLDNDSGCQANRLGRILCLYLRVPFLLQLFLVVPEITCFCKPALSSPGLKRQAEAGHAATSGLYLSYSLNC